MRKTIALKCDWCGNPFDRELTTHNNQKLLRGMKHIFCSKSCSSFHLNDRIKKGEIKRRKYQKRQNTIRKRFYSPFKYIINSGPKIRNKVHGGGFDIDEKYLKELWEKQDGICPYTGIRMMLPQNIGEQRNNGSLKKMSLDRIDSSKGYVKGNVEFVCLAINRAKNNRTKKELVDFLKEIKVFYSSTIL